MGLIGLGNHTAHHRRIRKALAFSPHRILRNGCSGDGKRWLEARHKVWASADGITGRPCDNDSPEANGRQARCALADEKPA